MSDHENKNLNFDIPLEGHSYDGIQELNNPAPFWWQLFFYLSIAFAVVYFIHYQILGGRTSDEELQTELNEIRAKQITMAPKEPEESALLAVFNQPNRTQRGQTLFVSKCASCHAQDGGGLVGPNLVDAYWIHGKGKPLDIFRVARDGVLDKGMPPWGAVLSQTELEDVTAYVHGLKGTKVANAKAPQGEKVNE